MIRLSQRVLFDAPHTLDRPGEPDAAGSRRWHGHSYQARVFFEGEPDPITGMLVDLGRLKHTLETIRLQLHDHMLDDITGLGSGTIENLSMWIWRQLAPDWPMLVRVDVGRDAHGDLASYCGPAKLTLP